ncbi:MAG: hypothetical protein KBA66_14320 [Leptospiraceae bacterium]|nr:hypothetical protein [Leptospiraceae bacterium]
MDFWKGLIIFIMGGSIFGFFAFVVGAFLFSDLGSEPTGAAALGFILLAMGILGFSIGGIISLILYWTLGKKNK